MYDISEERESQQALREAEARYRSLFENALEGIFRARLEDGRFLEVNPALAKMIGYDSPSEMLRHVSSSAALYVNVAEREQSVRELVGGGSLRRVVQFRRRDNSILWGAMSARLLESAGRPAEVEAMISDVTELRESAAEKQALLASLVTAQEEERHRIAGDIHDDPLQKVVAVGMRLGALRSRLDNPEHVALVETLEESVQLASSRLRNLLFELRPPSLDTSGLTDALRELVHQTMPQEETHCVVDSNVTREPGIETRAIAYRIAQEAIANARKHAKAKVIRICLRNEGRGVSVSVADDGVGINPEFTRRSAPGHMGLATMRERAQLAGGWIQVRSLPSGGTTVDFWVPDEAVAGDLQPVPPSTQGLGRHSPAPQPVKDLPSRT
jgi:PAS domain S-box-containing protein